MNGRCRLSWRPGTSPSRPARSGSWASGSLCTWRSRHRACQDALREHLCAKGGYILHLDATCEGDSPQLFSAMDELSRMVLGNRKMPSEDSRHMIPLLEELKAAYGVPLALVHDMGSAILKAAATVFPTVPSFVCHFHFLRDLGKDLFGFEYRTNLSLYPRFSRPRPRSEEPQNPYGRLLTTRRISGTRCTPT